MGCDGTSLNTGVDSGIIRRFELHLKRPLQRAVCLLHANELPLRHLIREVDGTTKTPTTFKGPVGQQLPNCHTLAAVPFRPITCLDFPSITPAIYDDLSSDQKYLYAICQLVLGYGDDKVLHLTPGPICHSRWLTTASRILRLYVSTAQTESFYDSLSILATFIIRCYAPMWFIIKSRPNIDQGSKHFFELIRRSRYLPVPLRKVIDKVLETNFFFAHSESVLLSMLGDEEKKGEAIKMIELIRQVPKKDGIRSFRKPKFQFELISSETPLTEFPSMIDMSKVEELNEPPLTLDIPIEELPFFTIPKYPAHTQSVERFVKLVTEASRQVTGSERRDGFVQTTTFSRNVTGKFESKQNYNVADKF